MSALLNKITDGHSVVTIGNYLIEELIDMTEEGLGLDRNHGWLSWWLYEDVDKIIYGEGEEVDVNALEDFYDFLVTQ